MLDHNAHRTSKRTKGCLFLYLVGLGQHRALRLRLAGGLIWWDDGMMDVCLMMCMYGVCGSRSGNVGAKKPCITIHTSHIFIQQLTHLDVGHAHEAEELLAVLRVLLGRPHQPLHVPLLLLHVLWLGFVRRVRTEVRTDDGRVPYIRTHTHM